MSTAETLHFHAPILRAELGRRAMTARLQGAGMHLHSDVPRELQELKDEDLVLELLRCQDDRVETTDPSVPEAARHQASAVAAVIPLTRLTQRPDGNWILTAPTMASFFNVHPGEPFRDQPVAAVGAASLISDQYVVTAAHVTPTPQLLRRVRFVFGYRVVDGVAKTMFTADHVYEATIFWIDRRFDLAILKLDRPVAGHHAPLTSHGTVVDGEELYVIGYPVGLPAKFAGNGRVVTNHRPRFFTADLDVMAANSGSPVFRASNGDLVGIVSTAPGGFTTVNGMLVSDFHHDPTDVPVGVSRITNLPR